MHRKTLDLCGSGHSWAFFMLRCASHRLTVVLGGGARATRVGGEPAGLTKNDVYDENAYACTWFLTMMMRILMN